MTDQFPKIVYLTAGAGGMFCGSCMHDNTLANALSRHGFDLELVPTYTPIRTDETDVSIDQLFFGGINVYLQQKFPPLRWLPGFLDRFLDNPNLIRRVASRAIDMPMSELGKLAVSMLKGTQGNQRKEVKRLCHWLTNSAMPDVIVFSNALIGGCIPEIKRNLDIPILVTLQGDDVFLDSLPEIYRRKCIDAIRKIVPQIDGFIVHTSFFKDYMSEYFEIPLEKIHITPLGIDVGELANLARPDDGLPPTIGYLARIGREKGLHNIVDAFLQLKQLGTVPNLQLRVAGWLGKPDETYAEENFQKIKQAGFQNSFRYVGSIERNEKLDFLSSIHVLSVPTEFLEPKGLYVFEAMACGIPVVQPAHGSFPEIIEQTGGGLLFEPSNLNDYCEKLIQILTDSSLRDRLGRIGQNSVLTNRNSDSMAQATADVIRQFLSNS